MDAPAGDPRPSEPGDAVAALYARFTAVPGMDRGDKSRRSLGKE